MKLAGGLTGGCLIDDISFVNNSSVAAPDNITAWDWDFGDLTTSNLQNPPDHNYASVGNYTIELTTTTNNGCQNIFQIPITIFPSPTAAFTVPDDCEENAAVFTDGSSITTGSITNWEWDFGDGNTSTTQNPTNLYGTSGTYTVELVVTSDIGCTDTILGSTVRFPKPLASFTVADVCEYDPAVTNDNSVVAAPDNIASWAWDFGDGNNGVGASANNVYSTYGPYDITLTATSTNGCVDDTTVTVNIQAQPIPDFITEAICVNTPPTVFVDMSSIGNGSMSQFDWDFGDATTGTGQGTTHTYGTDGVYNANLTVTSAFGCVNSVIKPVTVYEKPTANFMADSTYGCSPVNILFQDLSLSPSTTIDNWEWDFFGGNGTAGPNPVVSYINESSSPDLYDVGLIVTNGFGCKDTVVIYDYIEIFPTPEARFTFSPNVLTITESETTFNNGSVTADEYLWDFGDNSIPNTSENPTHTYPDNAPGEYLVELIAYNFGKTCSDTTWQLVKVQDIIIFYVPNMFTPDGDEFNETWKPIFYSGHDIFDFHLTVFNRWGEIVWESFDATKEWDGHYGTGGLVDDGAYVWTLDFKETMSDKRHQHNGHVTVVK